MQTDRSPDESILPSSQSESESDLEPDELIEKYLSLQRRLFEIDPESFEPIRPKQKSGKERTNFIKNKPNTAIMRLTRKLNKIKSDVLFDEDVAKHRWAEIHADLAREASDRRRLDIRNADGSEQPKTPQTLTADASKTASPGNEEDSNCMLGELFSGLPDSTTDPATGASGLSSTEPGGSTVKIKDYGRWTGMSPRRIFEEACKSR